MNEHAPGTESKAPQSLLNDIYNNRGIRVQKPFPPLKGVSTSDLPIQHSLATLVEKRFVAKQACLEGDQAVYRMTQHGLLALRQIEERNLRDVLGRKVTAQDVVYQRVVEEGGSFAGFTLGYSDGTDFWDRHLVNVWGTLGKHSEPCLLAQARIYRLDAEAALQISGMCLKTLFEVQPSTEKYIAAIENHDLDGEAAHHIYELTEMLGLPEAIGRQVIIIEDLQLNPALIGKGIGREIVKRLMLRVGKGGGIVMLPLRPYAADASAPEYDYICECLASGFSDIGFVDHPFVERLLVADIRRVSGFA